jgi:methyl-accepting chemotaxis protein
MKEENFGTSLKNGFDADTNLGHIFRTAIVATDDFTTLEDFAYHEHADRAFSFVASPIFDKYEVVGVLIFKIPTEQIAAIMQENAGLGETGETILISSDDFLMRSDSYFFKNSTLFKQKVDDESTRASAAGQIGIKEIIDYRGEQTIVAHTPVNVPGVNWSLNAKIDEREAVAAASYLLNLMLIIISIAIIIILGVAFFFSRTIAKPIQEMTHIATKLAEGNIKQIVKIESRDEIGVMGKAFQEMIINFQIVIEDIVYVSQGLAEGKLSIAPQSEYKGDFIQIKNALETALTNQRLVVEDIVPVSQGLAEGNLKIKPQADYQGDYFKIKEALEKTLTDFQQVIQDIVQISQGLAEGKENIIAHAEYRGDFIQIKNALESAGIKLSVTMKKTATQDWLKSGQNKLNEQMSGEQNIVELSHNVVSFMTLYLKAQVGLCYIIDDTANHQRNAVIFKRRFLW